MSGTELFVGMLVVAGIYFAYKGFKKARNNPVPKDTKGERPGREEPR